MLASLTSDSCGDTPTEMLKGEGALLQGFQNLRGNDHLQSSQTPHLSIHDATFRAMGWGGLRGGYRCLGQESCLQEVSREKHNRWITEDKGMQRVPRRQ